MGVVRTREQGECLGTDLGDFLADSSDAQQLLDGRCASPAEKSKSKGTHPGHTHSSDAMRRSRNDSISSRCTLSSGNTPQLQQRLNRSLLNSSPSGMSRARIHYISADVSRHKKCRAHKNARNRYAMFSTTLP